jgi:hypothetical protein
MKNWLCALAAMMLFSALSLGQATPISSTPDQPQSTAAAPRKSSAHVRKAKAHHTKAHHKGHQKHHKTV